MKVFIKKELYILGGTIIVFNIAGIALCLKPLADSPMAFVLRFLAAAGIGLIGSVLTFFIAIAGIGGGGRLHHLPRWLGLTLILHVVGLPLFNGVFWGYLFLAKPPEVLLPWQPMLLSLFGTIMLPYLLALAVFGLFPFIKAVPQHLLRYRRPLLILLLVSLFIISVISFAYYLFQPALAEPQPEIWPPFVRNMIIAAAVALSLSLLMSIPVYFLLRRWMRHSGGMSSGMYEMIMVTGLQIVVSVFCFTLCLVLVTQFALLSVSTSTDILNPLLFSLLSAIVNVGADAMIFLMLYVTFLRKQRKHKPFPAKRLSEHS